MYIYIMTLQSQHARDMYIYMMTVQPQHARDTYIMTLQPQHARDMYIYLNSEVSISHIQFKVLTVKIIIFIGRYVCWQLFM